MARKIWLSVMLVLIILILDYVRTSYLFGPLNHFDTFVHLRVRVHHLFSAQEKAFNLLAFTVLLLVLHSFLVHIWFSNKQVVIYLGLSLVLMLCFSSFFLLFYFTGNDPWEYVAIALKEFLLSGVFLLLYMGYLVFLFQKKWKGDE